MVRQDSQVSESPTFDDDILKQMYVEGNVPCDTLVSDPERLLSLADNSRRGQASRSNPPKSPIACSLSASSAKPKAACRN